MRELSSARRSETELRGEMEGVKRDNSDLVQGLEAASTDIGLLNHVPLLPHAGSLDPVLR